MFASASSSTTAQPEFKFIPQASNSRIYSAHNNENLQWIEKETDLSLLAGVLICKLDECLQQRRSRWKPIQRFHMAPEQAAVEEADAKNVAENKAVLREIKLTGVATGSQSKVLWSIHDSFKDRYIGKPICARILTLIPIVTRNLDSISQAEFQARLSQHEAAENHRHKLKEMEAEKIRMEQTREREQKQREEERRVMAERQRLAEIERAKQLELQKAKEAELKAAQEAERKRQHEKAETAKAREQRLTAKGMLLFNIPAMPSAGSQGKTDKKNENKGAELR